MSVNLILRKISRIFKSGSVYAPDYQVYKSYLQNTSDNASVSCFNLTVDFELAWSRARRGDECLSQEESLKRSRRAREVFPALIFLSEKYNIPITFAVVGHVALGSCAGHRLPPPFRPCWIRGDWYGIDPHTDTRTHPDYYGADLIAKIKNSRINHEIASHSFSHVDLADSETTPEVAKFEIEESYSLLKRIEPDLTTYIFAKNRPAFLGLIKNIGFTICRDGNTHPIRKNTAGLIEFPLGLWLSPKAHGPKDLVRLLVIAVQRRRLINFWFHLYEFASADELLRYLEPVFSRIANLQNAGTIKALTMRDIVKFYEQTPGILQRP